LDLKDVERIAMLEYRSLI
jgi:hypothetical protein